MGRRVHASALLLVCLFSFVFLTGATRLRPARRAEPVVRTPPADTHSYSNASQVAVRHVSLDIAVDFATRVISGSATLDVENLTGHDELVLDTNVLSISKVTLDSGQDVAFTLDSADPILGSALRIPVDTDTTSVTIEYSSSPSAPGLHWMSPAQAHQDTPYLYSQNETIDARSWIPVQDSPAVRMTWDATVRVDPGMMVVMSAVNPREKSADGVYTFEMQIPIPAYLQSIAVADLEFREIDSRSGVYAAPELIDAAWSEMQILPSMMREAEAIGGHYNWERYDAAIMPPSYHIGGMEHPRISFLNPSFISGDGSLVSLLAHELSHSWSGNTVTMATWADPWISEGLTVYFERRIMEATHGVNFEEMLAEDGLWSLNSFVQSSPGNPDSRLHGNWTGRHPNNGFSSIPYQKGWAFLRMIEDEIGRGALDAFLLGYFRDFQFDWLDADGWVAYFREEVVKGDAELEQRLRLNEWIYAPDLPANTPSVSSSNYTAAINEMVRFSNGAAASQLNTEGWAPQQFIHFLRSASPNAISGRIGELEATFDFSDTTNLSLLFPWSQWIAGFGYVPEMSAMGRYLSSKGAGSTLNNVYELLLNNGNAGRAMALYRINRPSYHPFAQSQIDNTLGFTAKVWSGPVRVPMPVKY